MSTITKNWTIERQRECNRNSYYKHKEKRLAGTKAWQQRIKREVLSHYCEDALKCACCGETIFEFLSIDHINGNGLKHREIVGSSYRYYSWLKRNKYPKGYRVLCHNCNQATSYGRTCPHKLMEQNR